MESNKERVSVKAVKHTAFYSLQQWPKVAEEAGVYKATSIA